MTRDAFDNLEPYRGVWMRNGVVVYCTTWQRRFEAVSGDIELLHTIVEDHIYDDDGGESIDWDGVAGDYCDERKDGDS